MLFLPVFFFIHLFIYVFVGLVFFLFPTERAFGVKGRRGARPRTRPTVHTKSRITKIQAVMKPRTKVRGSVQLTRRDTANRQRENVYQCIISSNTYRDIYIATYVPDFARRSQIT